MSVGDEIKKITSEVGNTVATVEQNASPPQLPDAPPAGAGWVSVVLGSGGAALIYGALALRRRLSRDSVEVTKDRVEGALLEAVMKERDAAVTRADKLQTQATLDAGTIAGLTEKNTYLQQELVRVNKAFERMEREMEALRTTIGNINNIARQPPQPSAATDQIENATQSPPSNLTENES